MFDDLNISWKMVGCAFAIFFILSAFRRKQRATSDKTVVLQRSSLAGRAGGALMAHAVLSTISGVLGFNVVIAFFSIVCAVPLMLMGAEVHLPEFVKAWPRSMIFRAKEAFIDKKEAIVEKIHDAKKAAIRKVTGKKDAPVDSDEFWGGPPDPKATDETKRNEWVAFDALPPEVKIAAFEAAVPADDAPKDMTDLYAPVQWYKVRIGRSMFTYTVFPRIAMYRALWTADQHHAHLMEPKLRAHFTRISWPHKPNDPKECGRNFNQLSAVERFLIFNGAVKLKRPLPQSIDGREGHTRDEQFYQVRVCGCAFVIMTWDEIEEAKNAAFEQMKELEAVAAAEERERPMRLVRAARDKAEDVADDLKDKAAHKAREVAADLKIKSSRAAHDFKNKAEEGVKEGAKGLFWKALGY